MSQTDLGNGVMHCRVIFTIEAKILQIARDITQTNIACFRKRGCVTDVGLTLHVGRLGCFIHAGAGGGRAPNIYRQWRNALQNCPHRRSQIVQITRDLTQTNIGFFMTRGCVTDVDPYFQCRTAWVCFIHKGMGAVGSQTDVGNGVMRCRIIFTIEANLY